MLSRSMRLFSTCLLLLQMNLASPAASDSPGLWQEKVDAQLLGQSDVEFIVFLEEQADLTAARTLRGKEKKGEYVFRALTATARKTQGGLLRELESRSVPYRSYWIANLIWAQGGPDLIQAIASRPEVSHLYANPLVAMQRPTPEQKTEGVQEIEWGIQMIRADEYWAISTGQGVVIGGQDTGYDWEHPALKNHYRGWNGVSADHDYNWHDAIHSGGGGCGANSIEPCDDSQHGTHTMGTMVGVEEDGSNQIGVAPGAQWIGCRNMNQGAGTPATYIECWQWFVAPTDLNNENPDPSKSPHVVNNSWSCPPSEGCTDPQVMRTVVENVRAAGIVPVVSAGNSGSGCNTVSSPAAIYDASITVGSTTSSDTISSFSSRGNVTVDGSGRMKPDVSAPGSSVRSSVPGGGYSTFSGTSMAGPHVAGQVALLISANPAWAGDVDRIELSLTSTAVPKTTAQTCGGVPGSEIPNNTYGWGRAQLPIDVFLDGFESGDTSAWDFVF